MLLWPRRGGSRKAVIDGFAEALVRHRHDGDGGGADVYAEVGVVAAAGARRVFKRRIGSSISRHDSIAMPSEITNDAAMPTTCAHTGTVPPKSAAA